MGQERLKIGISACFFHADPARPIFTGKTLQYVEQSVAHWVMSTGALAVMIPNPAGDTRRGDVELAHYAQWLDGLVLEGGSDVWPGSYGEQPLHERWSGDRVRDWYERGLLEAFAAQGKPVFGVCRGLQLMNVAFGGTLYQDIPIQRPDALPHLDAAQYDHQFHDVELVPGSHLSSLYPGVRQASINSIHHQAIKDLASELEVQARAVPDGIVEAVRWRGSGYVFGMQWHPEFLAQHEWHDNQLDGHHILRDFLTAVRQRRDAPTDVP